MRASGVAASLAVLALVAGTSDAGPRKKKKKKDDEIVDISSVKDKLSVYTDGEGGYFATGSMQTDWLFYGDGKTMYQQRVGSGGADGGAGTWSMRMWSPRVAGLADLDINGAKGTGTMTCGKDVIDLTKVPDAEAKKILDKAQFRKPLWRRQAHALSRDDRGSYYYVDRLRDENGGKGFRLFAGMKGAMKELPLVNIVSDSKGQIFSSKRGELRFVQEEDKAIWIKGDKKIELVNVPVEDNVEMIYEELGVYEGSLGTPCDEY